MIKDRILTVKYPEEKVKWACFENLISSRSTGGKKDSKH
jgi:hypothetical protein